MKRLWLIFMCVGLILIWGGCGNDESTDDGNNKEIASENDDTIYDSLVLQFDGQEGMTVFHLLEEKHEVDYIPSTIGNFVKAIDSIEISNDFSWMYSVNDSMGMVASDKYITSDSDLVKWHFRKQ